LTKDHRENQDLVVAKGAVKPLVTLAKSTKTLCQVKAASALESLATSNPEAQKEIDAADAQKPLIRLLKMWAIEVKEQGVFILMTQNLRICFLFLFLVFIFLNHFFNFYLKGGEGGGGGGGRHIFNVDSKNKGKIKLKLVWKMLIHLL